MIARLLCEEKLKWYQRAKCQVILEGDSNTRYFHSVANGIHRKKSLPFEDEGIIKGRTLSHTLLIITKNCLGLRRKETSQWMKPRWMSYPNFP
jgi:hypothetical protein